MSLHYNKIIDTPFARLGIKVHSGELIGVGYIDGERDEQIKKDDTHTGSLAADVARQIDEYVDRRNHRTKFEVPYIAERGTAFQRLVWREISQIGYGETMTYGEIAHRLGTSARAVGNACRSNPLVLIVPCHRVVSANGVGGYSGAVDGDMVRIKRWLLDHEQKVLASA